MRHAAKEREGFDQAVEDRLGTLSGEGEGKGAVGVRPGDEQDGDTLAARREIDVDVAEVGFEALAGVVIERDEGLGRQRPLGADIEAHPLRAAGVTVFVPEAAEDLRSGVPLFAGCVLVGPEDAVDDRLERVEDRRRRRPVGIG